ncbi:ubiquitin-conjugating enzyme/RWD-like protein [Dimargaris cristalligena]|uniref:Ubiquitin-conjugating enzyme/RWD-like protein n=1 Tax=Dimargaris cristalligena TaxID=215637 RepID=A0A4P9ZRR8_9FUNG|nr:ubiquitin-conjugating enzyme/RWD-like protein [Dimargaris cristalligena]|eukprot:RKP36107.1 ubiquitin-conjugating enzyme/RWD-like protein [Dimargaris cristalligena]
MPSFDDIREWFGVIFVHHGPYEGGTFKFVIHIPKDYPQSSPTVEFLTDMFHPLVGLSGEFSIAQRIPEWIPDHHQVYHVLQYIKQCFRKTTLKTIEEKHAFNKKALRMYHNEPTIFTKLATQCAQLSSSESVLYERNNGSNSNNPIQFSPLSDTEGKEK